jgi:hypothetical protein
MPLQLGRRRLQDFITVPLSRTVTCADKRKVKGVVLTTLMTAPWPSRHHTTCG